MKSAAKQNALYFLNSEKQFHLGFLPTEQSHPKTRNLDKLFADSTEKGIRNMQCVDRDVAAAAGKILNSAEFAEMVSAGYAAVSTGGRIVFSGCGATGRLSILLEAMWRSFFRKLKQEYPAIHAAELSGYEDRIASIMTGGDYALIRSVENFEDHLEFGRRQARDLNLDKGDVLVAITEGGETSSVLGTVGEALDLGASVFLLFNNPKELLCRHLERSRKVIEDPRVTVLELYSGPMAIAGSTRLQAVTFEMLVAGAALEKILRETLTNVLRKEKRAIPVDLAEIDYAAAFAGLLDGLEQEKSVSALAAYVDFESEIYRAHGLVTYFANDYLLDILTDTTERAPTFMLPPFRKAGDLTSPPSWAFVKNPLYPTPETWGKVLGRKTRCLNWSSGDYRAMQANENLCAHPPRLGEDEMFKFLIGHEADASRWHHSVNAAVMITAGAEARNGDFAGFRSAFAESSAPFKQRAVLAVGEFTMGDFVIPVQPRKTLLALLEHLAVKLVLNTVSTGSMVKLGRVTGNWMSWVALTNKKLLDRSIRCTAELCGLSQADACFTLFDTMEELKKMPPESRKNISPVQYTIRKLKEAKESSPLGKG